MSKRQFFTSFRLVKRLAGVAAAAILVTSAYANISGVVFCDKNGNQIQDAGEPGIAGVTVRLCELSKVTDANGAYAFSGAELATSACVQNASTQNPIVVTVDVTTVPGDCKEYSCPTSRTVPVTPASDVNFCFKPPTTPPPGNPGAGTPGFWKNHPEAWPSDTIEIGGIVYTKAVAIQLMQNPTKTDKTYNMFEQLVAAILNIEIGNDDSCIAADLVAADDWMALHPVGSGVSAESEAWTSISATFTKIDQYNNGLLCAPARD
jgi:hypothetical protein